MAMEKEVAVVHPEGEQELAVVVGGANQTSTVDTFGGMIVSVRGNRLLRE
jgi:hypothetical protein